MNGMLRKISLTLLLAVNGGAAIAAPPDIDLSKCSGVLPRHIFHARAGTSFQGEIRLSGGSGNNVFWAFLTEPVSETAGLTCKTVAPMAAFNCGDVNIRLPAGAPDNAVSDRLPARISGTPTVAGSVPFTIVVKVEGVEQTCTRPYLLQIGVENPDIEAPTVPGRLTALVEAPGVPVIVVSWGASTDAGKVKYLLERCEGQDCTDFRQIRQTTATNLRDRRLIPDTEYVYRVRAVDAAGNHSAFSEPASAHTDGPDPDHPH